MWSKIATGVIRPRRFRRRLGLADFDAISPAALPPRRARRRLSGQRLLDGSFVLARQSEADAGGHSDHCAIVFDFAIGDLLAQPIAPRPLRAAWAGIPGRITANSSPPNRPTISTFRTEFITIPTRWRNARVAGRRGRACH